MGTLLKLSQAARVGLFGLLGDTTPDAGTLAALYGSVKGKGANVLFGPLVGSSLVIYNNKATAGHETKTVVFKASHFADPFAPKGSEVIAAINAVTQADNKTVASIAAGGHLKLASSVAGADGVLQVSHSGVGQTSALEVLGLLHSQKCDVADFSLSVVLEAPVSGIIPLVQAHDWDPATNAYSAIAAAPVVSYDEDTGLLKIKSAEAANADVACSIAL